MKSRESEIVSIKGDVIGINLDCFEKILREGTGFRGDIPYSECYTISTGCVVTDELGAFVRLDEDDVECRNILSV